MNSILELLGVLSLCVVTVFVRLYILTKIFVLTVHPIVGGPIPTMFQMFAIAWFLGAVTYDPRSYEKKSTKENVTRLVSVNLAMLLSWGLAALIFG